MNLKDAVAVAKQHLGDLFMAEAPRDLRLETFLYDDHLMVWSLTIGFACGDARLRKTVRVSEANKSILSVGDA
jgi:hypothetical protein